PFFTLAASKNCTAAGGVLITKSNDLSLYTVICTGNVLPGLSWVLALNCLQNSMMLTPAAPKAGPTGGDGFAAPPFTCSLTTLLTSFAILKNFTSQLEARCGYKLCNNYTFSTCIKLNSNGVFLPKILTITSSLRFSSLIFSIVP